MERMERLIKAILLLLLLPSLAWGIYETYGEGKCNLVYVDDLVRTLISALENDAVVGKALSYVDIKE